MNIKDKLTNFDGSLACGDAHCVRDRLLLYVCNTDIAASDSVEIVAEALRGVPTDVSMSDAMERLHSVLDARGLLSDDYDASAMPLQKRSSMIAEDIDRAPWITAVKRFLGVRS